MCMIHLLHSEIKLGAQDRSRGRWLRGGQDFLGLHRNFIKVLFEAFKLHLDFLCERNIRFALRE